MYEWAFKMLHNFMVDVRHRCDMCPLQNVNLMFGDFNTRPLNKGYENTLKRLPKLGLEFMTFMIS